MRCIFICEVLRKIFNVSSKLPCLCCKEKYRKIDVACPASQLICARMMSFEDHLLLLTLAVFSHRDSSSYYNYYPSQLASVLIDKWPVDREPLIPGYQCIRRPFLSFANWQFSSCLFEAAELQKEKESSVGYQLNNDKATVQH